jgi:cytochrome c-type biogenesis protein CcmH
VSTFWVVAGALMLLVVAALAAPLLRRTRSDVQIESDASNVELYQDQIVELERDRAQGMLSDEQFEQARLELGQRLLADVTGETSARAEPAGAWRYVALAGVPITAVLAYLVLGMPESLNGKLATQADAGTSAERPHNLAELVERLAARVDRNPDDAEAWALLARSNQILGRPAEAVKAFARATELIPRSAQLWADYSDMLVASAGGQWTQAAKAALAKALALDRAHPKALWLAGSEAFVRRDFKAALNYWEQLAPMTEPGSDVARAIQGNIAEARALAGGENAAPMPATAAEVAASPQPDTAIKPASGDKALSGVVAIDPAIAARVRPSDTVFVFARAAQGPKMPLAIRRITVKDLPYEFTLDDSAAMAPGMTISAFDQIVIGARVSMSGDAAPKPGDFEGYSAPVKPGTSSIQVSIHAEIR